MMLLVSHVVVDQELQGDRRLVVDRAQHLQPLPGNPVDPGGQDLVLHAPPLEQLLPLLVRVSVRLHPPVLRVVWSAVLAAAGRPHKALPVVRRGIQQVPDDLFPRPAALAPRHIRQLRGHAVQCLPNRRKPRSKLLPRLRRQEISFGRKGGPARKPPQCHCRESAYLCCASPSAASTSSECTCGFTFVHTFTIFPSGSIRKVLRIAIVMSPKCPSDPYSSTTLCSVSESRWNVRLSFAQNCLWLSVESTLTPRITAPAALYLSRSRWKLCASIVQPGVMSLG